MTMDYKQFKEWLSGIDWLSGKDWFSGPLSRKAVEEAMDAYDDWQVTQVNDEIFGTFGPPRKFWVRSTRDRATKVYPTKPIVGFVLKCGREVYGGGWIKMAAAALLHNAGFIIVDQNDKPVVPPKKWTHLIRNIKQAEYVRRCASNYHIAPARELKMTQVSIRAAELARDLGLSDRVPNVFQSLKGSKFQELAEVPAPRVDGKKILTYTLDQTPPTPTLDQTPPTGPSPYGLKNTSRSEKEIADDLFRDDYLSKKVKKTPKVIKTFERNLKAVREMKRLYKTCQITGDDFVFSKVGGKPYLEVHHLVPLGEGGSDDPANLVVISAHIHRMLHYAVVEGIDLSKIREDKLDFTINGEAFTITWRPDHAKVIADASGAPPAA